MEIVSNDIIRLLLLEYFPAEQSLQLIKTSKLFRTAIAPKTPNYNYLLYKERKERLEKQTSDFIFSQIERNIMKKTIHYFASYPKDLIKLKQILDKFNLRRIESIFQHRHQDDDGNVKYVNEHIHNKYQQRLNKYGIHNFYVYKRGHLFMFDTLSTTLNQLHFFMWFMKRKIYHSLIVFPDEIDDVL